MKFLDGLAIVSMALNLPGPVACARLRDLGARVTKVEPPGGDPLATYCAGWYEGLHAGMDVRRIDLKAAGGLETLHALLGLDAASLGARHPRLCALAIIGHAPPGEETPGHDLTYLAEHGLVAPPNLPPTLFADMAGAERTVATALALIHARNRDGRGTAAAVSLAEAAAHLAQPLAEGLTRGGGPLGGGLAGYNLYPTRNGWIAVAVLEPHFARRLAESLGIEALSTEALTACFATESAEHWEDWARALDLPLVAVRSPLRA
jgi:alpha-methylacyl-CoA racemase